MSEVITNRKDQINQLIADTKTITIIVNDNQAQLAVIVGQGRDLTQKIVAREELVTRLLDGIAELTEQASAVAGENANQFAPPIMANLNTITQGLEKNRNNLRKLLEILPVTARLTNNVIGDGPYVNGYLPGGASSPPTTGCAWPGWWTDAEPAETASFDAPRVRLPARHPGGAVGMFDDPGKLEGRIRQAIEVTAYFDNVAGLYVSNDVAVLGMPVGQVTAVEPQGDRVKVTMTIDNDVPVPADATAAIVNTSIVTTRHVELTPPAYEGGPRLEDGSVLKETKAPVSVGGELFDAIDGLVVSLKGEGPGSGPLADMIDITSGGIATGNGEEIRAALDQLGQASNVVSGNSDALVDIIETIEGLTTTLVKNYPKMTAFSKSVNEVSELLGSQSPGLVATLRNLNQTLQNTTAFLQNNTNTISVSFDRLAALTANLSDYSRQVVETIDVGPLLFQNLGNSISAEQGTWRAQVLLDKSLVDNELLAEFCEAINLQKDGCRTGKLKDFGPDMGIYSAMLELTK